MAPKKRIAVVGATGSQGGGLLRAILADPDREFTARALTRNQHAVKAQELLAAGAEVVEADLDNEASVREAFDETYGAYVVTNYWAERTPEEEAVRTRADMELQQAEVAAKAARNAGVTHVIWSTLEDTRAFFGEDDRVPTVDGRYKVPHFDAKAEADRIFFLYGVPTTFLRTTFFFEGFTGGLAPRRSATGELELTVPMADQPLSGIAVEDIGKTALGIFRRGAEFIGKTVSIAGDHLTGDEYAAAFTEALGETVVYRPSSWDAYRAQDFPEAVEMGNMFQYYAENAKQFTDDRDVNLVRTLNPDLQSFRDWLALHKDRIPLG
ncbi:NmrA/HSCARG family protein [Nocardia sp. NPDC049220]|uniref:NmrA/HSCARG family protein n=1 Tax=Nocardia sp. NPDC049220 TaxID=3155273 RepID=UPI0033FE03D5